MEYIKAGEEALCMPRGGTPKIIKITNNYNKIKREYNDEFNHPYIPYDVKTPEGKYSTTLPITNTKSNNVKFYQSSRLKNNQFCVHHMSLASSITKFKALRSILIR